MTDEYDPKQVLIERLPLKGVRVDRVHGREYIVNPRYYRVNDANLRTRGDWTVELHKKLVERTSGDLQEVTIVKSSNGSNAGIGADGIAH